MMNKKAMEKLLEERRPGSIKEDMRWEMDEEAMSQQYDEWVHWNRPKHKRVPFYSWEKGGKL